MESLGVVSKLKPNCHKENTDVTTPSFQPVVNICEQSFIGEGHHKLQALWDYVLTTM